MKETGIISIASVKQEGPSMQVHHQCTKLTNKETTGDNLKNLRRRVNLKSKKLMMVFFFTIFQNTFIVQSVLEKKKWWRKGGGGIRILEFYSLFWRTQG